MRSEPESNIQTLIKRVQRLEREKEALRLELWRQKRKPSGIAGHVLLLLGAIALATSIPYSSLILAFIGLGLAFWGVLFLYIKPTKYVKSELLDSTTISSLSNIDKLITDLKYQGKGVYLSPRTLKELKAAVVFVPYTDATNMPSAEEMTEEKVFLENPKGIRLAPTGLALSSLFEIELGTDLTTVDLNYLQNSLPKVLVEDLEIAEDFEMETNGQIVHVKIKRPIYKELCKEVRKLQNICPRIGCPLCSSIACLLTRVTDKPILIDRIELTPDEEAIEAYYRMISG